jgi:hypothetical protein
MRQKKAVTTVMLVIISFIIVAISILFSLFLVGLSQKEIIGLKLREQGGTELYSLLEQDFCVSGTPFREVIAQGILQGMDSPDFNITYYKEGEATPRKVSPRQCIESYMAFITTANRKEFISDATCTAFIRKPPVVGYINSFIERVCTDSLSYKLVIEHVTCSNKCLNMGDLNPAESDVPDQVVRIAVPDGRIATAVLSIKRH